MRYVRKLIPLAVLLALWWLASLLCGPRLVPTPWETGKVIGHLAKSGELWRHLSLTVFRGLGGLLLGLAMALLLGVPCGFFRPVMGLLSPLVTAMQSCPPIIWISFLLVWVKGGNAMPMLVVFAAVFPACFLNVAQGVAGLDRRLLEMAKVYRIPRLRVLRQIVLPGISRFAVASLSFALGITWKVTATAEFFGAPSGVGERIFWSHWAMQMPQMFAWTAVIVAVGVILELGVVHPLREALDHDKAGAAVISLEHVAVALGGHRILEDVSLNVAPGEIVCLFGPSGCGKTTVLRVAAGLVHPHAGQVSVRSERLGYAFQDDRLAPWLSVRDNLLLALSGQLGADEAAARTDCWLARLDLGEAAGKRPGALSGGMCRRVNLARALALQPDLLLLDEPFAFLDSAMVETVQRLVLDLRDQHGTTILIVSHVREHVAGLGAEIVPVSGPPVRLTYPSPGE